MEDKFVKQFQEEEDQKIFQWLKNLAETSRIEQEEINKLRENNPSALPLDIPCKHPGCLHHRTHPCEGCGRMHGEFSKEELKIIKYIQDRYERKTQSGTIVCHFGDCNFYNAHFPFCDCGLMRDLSPVDSKLVDYLYPKFHEDYDRQMLTRGLVEEHFLSMKEQEVQNERTGN